MFKVCRVCGRNCPEDALQCSACRSSEFKGQPSSIEEYKLAQKQRIRLQSVRELENASSDLSRYPFNLGWPLFIFGAVLVVVGVVFSGALGAAVIIIGSIFIALSSLLSRFEFMKVTLDRRIKRIRQK